LYLGMTFLQADSHCAVAVFHGQKIWARPERHHIDRAICALIALPLPPQQVHSTEPA
jgi:hypothetical protein